MKKIKKLSELEETFALQLRVLKTIPKPEREYKFLVHRKFRFDFCWPDRKLAVEIDGGTWSGGRHTSGGGYASDCLKLNLAILEGWYVMRFTGDQVKRGDAFRFVEQWFNEHGGRI